MVAVGAGVAGPKRQFSAFILGGVWPITSTGSWTTAAAAQRTFAQTSRAGASDIGASASAILSDNDGRMIEGMHVVYQGDSKAVEAQADLFTSMADAIDECARIVDDARTQMDAIDQQAHDAIQKIMDSKGGWFGALAMMSMIWAILTQARAAAEAVSAAAASDIASQAGKIEAATVPSPGGAAGPPAQAEPIRERAGPVLHGGNGSSRQKLQCAVPNSTRAR